jgi:1-acyl-sn-glycerol-3-phosphate acyltransferase
MKNLRAFFRLVVFTVYLLIVLLIFWVGLLFCFASQGMRLKWKNWIISRWAGNVAAIIGLKIHVQGSPPEPPFFLISNHLSYIDILPFWKHLKTTFVAKIEIKSWPFFGIAARLMGIIFINRENRQDLNRVNSLIEDNITEEQGVILFPEGTSSRGAEVLPFKSSLLHYPASHDLSVHYASISYSAEGEAEAWKDICWWGEMDFLTHFWNLLKIKSSTAHIHFGDSSMQDTDRKSLSRKLHQAVAKNFNPTTT